MPRYTELLRSCGIAFTKSVFTTEMAINGHDDLKEQHKLSGKVGIVTGAGTPHGIGRELVKKLAGAGALAVYACDLNLGAIPSLQDELQKLGYATIVEGRLLDVSDEQQTKSIVEEVVAKHGRFDFYFANAGFANYRSVVASALNGLEAE